MQIPPHQEQPRGTTTSFWIGSAISSSLSDLDDGPICPFVHGMEPLRIEVVEDPLIHTDVRGTFVTVHPKHRTSHLTSGNWQLLYKETGVDTPLIAQVVTYSDSDLLFLAFERTDRSDFGIPKMKPIRANPTRYGLTVGVGALLLAVVAQTPNTGVHGLVAPSVVPRRQSSYLSRKEATIRRPNSCALTMSSGEEDKASNKKTTQGVYVRPSGAIERGSGFFFPGLEGPKVRVLFGVVLLSLTAVNHLVAASASSLSPLSLSSW